MDQAELHKYAIIFDMDGVLVDSEPLICKSAILMFEEYGIHVRPEDFTPFIGTGESKYIGGVAEKYGLDIDLTVAKTRTYQIYLSLVDRELHPYPGAVELAKTCKYHGLRCAIASSADKIKILANINKIGLPDSFWSAIISSEHVLNKKPAPDIFITTAAILGVPQQNCIVIEDSVHGIHAAKAANMHCIAVAHTFPLEKLREADLVANHISELSLKNILAVLNLK